MEALRDVMQYNVAEYLDWYEIYELSRLYQGRDRYPFLERIYSLLQRSPEQGLYGDSSLFEGEERARGEMWSWEREDPEVGEWLLDKRLYPTNHTAPQNLSNMLRLFAEAPDDFIESYLEIFAGGEDYDNPTLAEAILVSPVVRERVAPYLDRIQAIIPYDMDNPLFHRYLDFLLRTLGYIPQDLLRRMLSIARYNPTLDNGRVITQYSQYFDQEMLNELSNIQRLIVETNTSSYRR